MGRYCRKLGHPGVPEPAQDVWVGDTPVRMVPVMMETESFRLEKTFQIRVQPLNQHCLKSMISELVPKGAFPLPEPVTLTRTQRA